MCSSSATSCAASTAASSAIANKAYEHHYAGYFQDRWKPSSQVAIKAGMRVENNQRLHGRIAQKVLGALLPPGVPTNIADEEFHQMVDDAELRHRVRRRPLGCLPRHRAAAATNGSTWAAATGRRTRRTCSRPTSSARIAANQPDAQPVRCPAAFRWALNFGGTEDGSIHNGRTYVNEFSGSWEHRLPRSSSFSTTFVLAAELGLSERRRPERDSRSDHRRAARPAVPASTTRSATPTTRTTRGSRTARCSSCTPKHFTGRWGMNANYSYILSSTIPHAVESDVGPAAVLRHQPGRRHCPSAPRRATMGGSRRS